MNWRIVLAIPVLLLLLILGVAGVNEEAANNLVYGLLAVGALALIAVGESNRG